MSFNEIITYIWKDRHYHNIMETYLTQSRLHLKSELFSEIYLDWNNNQKKIEDLFNRSEKEFGAYFNMTVANNVKSKTSRFYYNVLKRDCSREYIDNMDSPDDSDEVLLEKIRKENRLRFINSAIYEEQISWFERQMFLEYYQNDITYDELADKYGLNRSYIYKVVRAVRDKIKKRIK